METKRKPRKAPVDVFAPTPQPPPVTTPTVAAAPVADDNDMVAILALLAASHGKVAAGEISAADYTGKMRQLLEFARFLFGK